MGEAEIIAGKQQIILSSHLITYGHAADTELTERIREEIETMWNEIHAVVMIKREVYQLIFRISAAFAPGIMPIEIYQNLDPRNNYFRIENFATQNISFVDGLGCNSGYFLLENLYAGSTTAAHEYGHTLGLPHPDDLDYRGRGIPGIMYPRGTLVDAAYQYDSSKIAGETGGTMHPRFRRVRQVDVDDLQLARKRFIGGKGVVGEFSNVYHEREERLRV